MNNEETEHGALEGPGKAVPFLELYLGLTFLLFNRLSAFISRPLSFSFDAIDIQARISTLGKIKFMFSREKT